MKIEKIEKGVSIPEVHSDIKYPWPEMAVGDSVFIQPEKGQDLPHLLRKVGPSARYYGEKTEKRFKTMLDRENNGVRIWRVE